MDWSNFGVGWSVKKTLLAGVILGILVFSALTVLDPRSLERGNPYDPFSRFHVGADVQKVLLLDR
jgi:hypothetical protein